MNQPKCDWCADSKARLNTRTMKMEDCTKCPKPRKVVIEETVDLAKKYADRVRVGKTAKDKSRHHHKMEAA